MAISKTDDLFYLIKSLTKSEKRSLRVFAERIQGKESLQYMQLFDVIDKINFPNDDLIIKKMKGVTPIKYSNLKRHLYEQILTTLRLTEKSKKPTLRIRELIDYVYVLYGKGFYMQALKVIGMAKKLAEKNHTDFSMLTLVEIEKMILSRHITRSSKDDVYQLIEESKEVSDNISNRVSLSNLRLFLGRFYIEKGHVKNKEEEEKFKTHFEEYSAGIIESDLGMMEKVYYYQSYVTFYYIVNDFENCLIYSKKWVDLFKESKELRTRDIDLFFKGYYHLLISNFNLKQTKEHRYYLNEVEAIRRDHYKSFNTNTQIESFLRVHAARLNQHFLDGNFKGGLERVKSTLRRIQRYREKLDEHKVMVLYYKIAWMYMGAGNTDEAVKYLQYIINMTTVSLRDDIQTYSRILHLMAHYDIGNHEILPFLNKQYMNFFKKVKEKNELQTLCFKLFRDLGKAPLGEQKDVFARYYAEIKPLEQDEYEKRAFNYLEIIPWIESKLKKQSIQQIIEARGKLNA